MSKKNATELRAIATATCEAWRAIVEKHAATPPPKDCERKDPVTAQDHLARTLFAIDRHEREIEEVAARRAAFDAVEAAERAEGDELITRRDARPAVSLAEEEAAIAAEYQAKLAAAREKHAAIAADQANARFELAARRTARGEPSTGPTIETRMHSTWIANLREKEIEIRAALEAEARTSEQRKRDLEENKWSPGATNVQTGVRLTDAQRKLAEAHRSRTAVSQ